MASRIKGITVEIGGDTTKLDKSLKDVNNTIRSTQTQLKDVERLLKLDPKNTELLKQKQDLLNETIKNTKEKLEALKSAAEQANKSLEDGTVTKEQYNALKREIIATEESLKKLGDEAIKTNTALSELDKVRGRFEKIGGALTNAANKTKFLSAGATAMGVGIIKVGAEFEKGMSKVKAVSGATAEELKKLENKAIEIGDKTKFSAIEATDALNYMAMAGWKSAEMLEGMDGIVSLAAASELDLGQVCDIVTDGLTAFGLKAKDASHFSDVLAVASSNANTDVEKMGETFKYTAPIAGALGYSIEDTALAIGLMANAGIKSSIAGTALKNIMSTFNKDIEITGKEIGKVTVLTKNQDGTMRNLKDVIIDCKNAFNNLSESEKLQNAELLFGTQSMTGFLSIVNSSDEDFNKLSVALQQTEGAAENMQGIMSDNLAGSITTLNSKISTLSISLSQTLSPIVLEVVEFLQKLVGGFNGLSDNTKGFIVYMGIIVAVLSPVLFVFGSIANGISSIIDLFGKLSPHIKNLISGLSKFWGVLNANPIMAIIGIIVLFVGAIITLWNTNEEFRETWKAIWEDVKNFTTNILNNIKDFFKHVFESIKDFVTNVITNIKDFINNGLNTIKNIFTTIFNNISNVVQTIFNSIKDFIMNILNNLSEFLKLILENAKEFITMIINSVKDFIFDTLKNIVIQVSNNLKNMFEIIKKAFGEMLQCIINEISAIYKTIVDGFNKAVSFIKGLISQAWTWGSDLVNGMVNGIKSSINNVVNAVKDVAGTIRSYLHFSVPDVGPLTDYETWMPDFMQGLAKGINNNLGVITNAANNVAQKLKITPTIERTQIIESIPDYNQNTQSQVKDIVIPVYIGGNMLDEIIVSANDRINLIRGGR